MCVWLQHRITHKTQRSKMAGWYVTPVVLRSCGMQHVIVSSLHVRFYVTCSALGSSAQGFDVVHSCVGGSPCEFSINTVLLWTPVFEMRVPGEPASILRITHQQVIPILS